MAEYDYSSEDIREDIRLNAGQLCKTFCHSLNVLYITVWHINRQVVKLNGAFLLPPSLVYLKKYKYLP